jgi:uncharacterized membrane protein YagU involved in acid resistance
MNIDLNFFVLIFFLVFVFLILIIVNPFRKWQTLSMGEKALYGHLLFILIVMIGFIIVGIATSVHP